MTRNILDIPTALSELNDLFVDAGYELHFVGGCVRDSLIGIAPKDIDLATSATPEQQIELYRANNVRYIATGLQHGTVTVVIDGEPYEITTYRIDRETDGRHAIVEYTRSLREDLARRDLTINAIAMTFSGEIVDPFGGAEDILDGRVRFVGDADARIQEDYLRILRFFRFFGRFGYETPRETARETLMINRETLAAVKRNRSGLARISVERVWAEISKIITGPNASAIMDIMKERGISEVIGVPSGYSGAFGECARMGISDPATLMGWYCFTPEGVSLTADRWKWSNEERARALFIAENRKDSWRYREYDVTVFQRMLVDGVNREWVRDLITLYEFDPTPVMDWEVPEMPVKGDDLIQMGIKPGPQMGQMLREMRNTWIKSDYTLDKNELLGIVRA